MLKGCFECTEWDVLFSDNLESSVDVITEYMQFCIDGVIPDKEIKCFPNNKPWVTKDLKELLNKKKRILGCKDKDAMKEVQKEIKSAIVKCKKEYKDKIEDLFDSNNSKSAWKGLKLLTGYATKSSLPNRMII